MMNNDPQYLVDSSSFITPAKLYYAFDLVPSYWEVLNRHVRSGDIAIPDKIKSEIDVGGDSLSAWINESNIKVINTGQVDIINVYGKIINYISESKRYNSSALVQWSKDSIADPWLIATSKVLGCTLVTEEHCQYEDNSKNIYKSVKIPDVAKVFCVECIDVFEMMRRIGISI